MHLFKNDPKVIFLWQFCLSGCDLHIRYSFPQYKQKAAKGDQRSVNIEGLSTTDWLAIDLGTLAAVQKYAKSVSTDTRYRLNVNVLLDSSLSLFFATGNIALHIFMPKTRAEYDIESLWTVGTEFDENMKEKTPDDDPFAAYLKDFGRATHEIEPESLQSVSTPETQVPETTKRPYAKRMSLESGNWHNQ